MKTNLIVAPTIAFLLAMPLPAHATDEAEGETSSPSTATESQSDEEDLSTRAVGVSVDNADDAQRNSAQEAFASGDEAFDVQDYNEALKSFELSYSIVASPNSRLMIARTLLELGRLDETFEEYDGVIKDAADREQYATTADTAEKEQDALRSRLAWVTIEWVGLIDGATLEVAGRKRSLKDADEAFAVVPGKTQINAVSPDGEQASAIVHLAAGRSAEVKLKAGETLMIGSPPVVKPPPKKEETAVAPTEVAEPRPRSLRPYAYAAAGVGVLGFATFATFGLLSGKHYENLEDDCTDGSCPPESQDDIDSGKTQQLVANIGLGVGIAGIGTGVLLYVLDLKQRGPVQVGVGVRSLIVHGEF